MPASSRRSLRPYAALLFAAASWGVGSTGAKYAVDRLGAITTLTIGVGTAAALLWTVLLVRRPVRVVPLRRYLLLALLEPTVAYGGLDLGLRRTTASDAALLDGLQSAMVLVIGLIALKEAASRRSVTGVLIATFGAALVAGVNVSFSASLGNALVLLGTLGASASVVLVSVLARDGSALEITAYQFGFGFLMCLPLLGWQWLSNQEQLPASTDLGPILAAVGVGLVCFAIAYVLYNYATGEVPVGVAGMALNVIPIFGVLAAVTLLDERLGALQVIGGILIITGIALFPLQAEGSEPTEPPTPQYQAAALPMPEPVAD
ncbi:MAG: DMT family transporter [Jatrophihabitantaceae bacterium]